MALPVFNKKRYFGQIQPPQPGRFYLQDGVYFDHDGTPTARYDKLTGIESEIGADDAAPPAPIVQPAPKLPPVLDRVVDILPADWPERDLAQLRRLARDYGLDGKTPTKTEAYAFLETIHDEQRARQAEQAPVRPKPAETAGGLTWSGLSGQALDVLDGGGTE